MMMRPLYCLCFAALLMAATAPGLPETHSVAAEGRYSMRVTVDDAVPTRLLVELQYLGDGQVEMYRSALPWGSIHSLILVVVMLDPFGTSLEQVFPIDDPAPDRLVLHSGEIERGRVDLRSRFPALATAAPTKDLMVFWTYQLRDIKGSEYDRLSGYVRLPRPVQREERHD